MVLSFSLRILVSANSSVVSPRLFRATLNLVVRPTVPRALTFVPVSLTIPVFDDRFRSRNDEKLAAVSGRPIEFAIALFPLPMTLVAPLLSEQLKVQLVARKNYELLFRLISVLLAFMVSVRALQV